MQAALDHLRATGYPVQDSDLEYLSPITSAHINLHGSHHLDLQAPKSGKDNCAPCGQHLRCSKEAKERLSVVNFSGGPNRPCTRCGAVYKAFTLDTPVKIGDNALLPVGSGISFIPFIIYGALASAQGINALPAPIFEWSSRGMYEAKMKASAYMQEDLYVFEDAWETMLFLTTSNLGIVWESTGNAELSSIKVKIGIRE